MHSKYLLYTGYLSLLSLFDFIPCSSNSSDFRQPILSKMAVVDRKKKKNNKICASMVSNQCTCIQGICECYVLKIILR